MFGSAGDRFWAGIREPWELLGRMRADRPLWRRYWRTVLVQAALTLVAGAAVFWVGKQGAEAWNDAFGPEEPVEAVTPSTSVPPVSDATSTPAAGAAAGTGDAPSAPAAVPAPDPSKKPRRGTGKAHGADVAPAPAPATPPRAPGETRSNPTTPAASSSPAEERAAAGKTPGADPDEGSEPDEEPAADDSPDDAALEQQIEALKAAPPAERAKRTAELVAAAIARANAKAGRTERAARGRAGTDPAEELAEARSGLEERIDALALEAEALASLPASKAGDAKRDRRKLEHQLDQVEKEAAALARRGAAPLTAAERTRLDHARASLASARRHERGLAGRLGAVLALLAAIYASLGIAQTGILALSRDFHDVLSRELSLLVHVAPEDPPMRPRIRLDVPWVRRKANRRAQFFLGFLPGQAMISLFARLVPPHRVIATVLTAIWASYWWMVMTAGQSARAWSPPETTPRPWYMRAWFSLTDRVILFRWALPRMWGRLWERFSRRFYGPAERVEEQPFEFAGLALSRAVTLFPVVKLLFRPLFPVCAAHLLVEHAATARLPVAVTPSEVADAAAHAPDPEARTHSGMATR